MGDAHELAAVLSKASAQKLVNLNDEVSMRFRPQEIEMVPCTWQPIAEDPLEFTANPTEDSAQPA